MGKLYKIIYSLIFDYTVERDLIYFLEINFMSNSSFVMQIFCFTCADEGGPWRIPLICVDDYSG